MPLRHSSVRAAKVSGPRRREHTASREPTAVSPASLPRLKKCVPRWLGSSSGWVPPPQRPSWARKSGWVPPPSCPYCSPPLGKKTERWYWGAQPFSRIANSPRQKSKSEKNKGENQQVRKSRRLNLNTKRSDFPPKIVDSDLHFS
jgi:hypothetical protein